MWLGSTRLYKWSKNELKIRRNEVFPREGSKRFEFVRRFEVIRLKSPKVLLAVAYGQGFGSIYDGDDIVMRSADENVSLETLGSTNYVKIKHLGHHDQLDHHATHQSKRHDLRALLRSSRRLG